MAISWTNDLNTGIEVLDEQHRLIVDYINQLDEAIRKGEASAVGLVLEELADYAISHLKFEEKLMEQADYPFLKPHKKVHDLFVARLEKYQRRYLDGEDVAQELHDVLANWLVQHIKHTDMAYVSHLNRELPELERRDAMGWLGRSLKQFFGGERRVS